MQKNNNKIISNFTWWRFRILWFLSPRWRCSERYVSRNSCYERNKRNSKATSYMYDPLHVYTVTWLTTDMYMDNWLSEYTNIKMKINKTIYLIKYVHIFVQDLDVMCNVIITLVTETRKSIFYCSTRETLWYILYSGKYLHLHVHVYMYYFKMNDKAKTL